MRFLLVILSLIIISTPAFPDEQSDIEAVERAWLIEQETIKIYNRTIKRAASAIAKSSLQKMVNVTEQEYATAWDTYEKARKKHEKAQDRLRYSQQIYYEISRLNEIAKSDWLQTSPYTSGDEYQAKNELEKAKKRAVPLM